MLYRDERITVAGLRVSLEKAHAAHPPLLED
jgi:hypothetical protein